MSNATVCTRDKTVTRKLDALVTEFPDIFHCIGETHIDHTNHTRRSRRISEVKREHARIAMKKST